MRRLLLALALTTPLIALDSAPAAAWGWGYSGYGYAPYCQPYRSYYYSYRPSYGYAPYYGAYWRPRFYAVGATVAGAGDAGSPRRRRTVQDLPPQQTAISPALRDGHRARQNRWANGMVRSPPSVPGSQALQGVLAGCQHSQVVGRKRQCATEVGNGLLALAQRLVECGHAYRGSGRCCGASACS